MDDEDDPSWIRDTLTESLNRADKLVQICVNKQDITGMNRFKKKCLAELRFLKRLEKDLTLVRSAHLTSSNLLHLEATIGILDCLPMVCEVDRSFRTSSRSHPVVVEVICNHGYTWVKVIARSSKALELDVAGNLEYCERSVLTHAQDLAELSCLHPHNFVSPSVVFVFLNNIPHQLEHLLGKLGVKVVSVNDLKSGAVSSAHLLPADNVCDTKRVMVSPESENLNNGDSLKNKSGESCSIKKESAEDQFEKLISITKFNDLTVSAESINNTSTFVSSAHVLSNASSTTSSTKLSDSLQSGSALLETSNSVSLSQCNTDSENEISYPQSCCDALSVSPSEKEIMSSGNTRSAGFPTAALVPECDNLSELSQASNSNSFRNNHYVNNHLARQLVNVCLNTNTSLDGILSSGNADTYTMPSIVKELSVLESVTQESIKLNLDVTAMIALISNQCYGYNNFTFKDDILTQQAAEERTRPVLPRLFDFISGKHLVACSSAIKDFKTILHTIGGPVEKKRADVLLASIEPISDEPSSRALSLKESSRIRKRSKIIFGSGDRVRAVTVTANEGFVRAARQAGVEFSVYLHPARALTEQKQITAVPIICDK